MYTDTSPKKISGWQSKHMKRFSTVLVIRKRQTKITEKCYYTPIRPAKIRKD